MSQPEFEKMIDEFQKNLKSLLDTKLEAQLLKQHKNITRQSEAFEESLVQQKQHEKTSKLKSVQKTVFRIITSRIQRNWTRTQNFPKNSTV